MKRFKIADAAYARQYFIIMVDDTYAYLLRNYVWRPVMNRALKKDNQVVFHRFVNGEEVWLHKIIAGAGENEKVRFLDGNELNMQRSNMVVMSRQAWYVWFLSNNKLIRERKKEHGSMEKNS